MKVLNILIVLSALLFSSESNGQSGDIDSLKAKILKMDLAINNMHNNMVKSHKEFKIGVWNLVAGTVLTIIGATQDAPEGDYSPLLALGGTISLGGTILIIDSHKYFGYGGRKGKKKKSGGR